MILIKLNKFKIIILKKWKIIFVEKKKKIMCLKNFINLE
jgi:hypothetical protein